MGVPFEQLSWNPLERPPEVGDLGFHAVLGEGHVGAFRNGPP